MELKQKYLPESLWMRNKTQRWCFACDKAFGTFRRKHHCRYCGYIFCSQCLHYKAKSLQGKQLEKCCDKCYALLAAQVKTKAKSEYELLLQSCLSVYYGDNNLHRDNDGSFKGEFEVWFDNWRGLMEGFFMGYIKDLVKQQELDQYWEKMIYQNVIMAVQNIQVQQNNRKDLMDINQYLKITTILTESQNFLQYINGIVIKRNIAHRKMPKSIKNPRILLINDYLEFSNYNDLFEKMQKILLQAKEYNSLTFKKLQLITPTLILTNKSISYELLEQCQNQNIACLIKVKDKQLGKIARITQGLILQTLDEWLWHEKFIGECKKFKIFKHQGQDISIFSGGQRGLGGSILLYGTQYSTIKRVKSIIRELVLDCRSNLLELFFLNKFTDIKDTYFEPLKDNIIRQIKINSKNVLCTEQQLKNYQFYSENDISLAQQLYNLFHQSGQACMSCKQTNDKHRIYLLKPERRIKITISYTDFPIQDQSIGVQIYCKICEQCHLSFELEQFVQEISFYKLMTILMISEVQFSYCGHALKQGASIRFLIKDTVISIDSEQNTLYQVLDYKPNKDISDYYNELLEGTVQEIQLHSGNVLEILIKDIDSLQNQEQLDYEQENNSSFIEHLNDELNVIRQNIWYLIGEVNSLSKDQFSIFLQVETHRRQLFLNICNLKVQVENIKYKFQVKNQTKSGQNSIETPVQSQNDLSFLSHDSGSVFTNENQDLKSLAPVQKMSLQDQFILSDDFKYLQRGCITFIPGINDLWVSVEEFDILSVVAYSLITQQYQQAILDQMDYDNLDDLIENELLSPFHQPFTQYFQAFNEGKFQESNNKTDLQRLYGPQIQFHVVSFYPRQFQALRLFTCGDHAKFVDSISMSMDQQVELGKSGAKFMFSHDCKYVLKIIEENECKMFNRFAPNYFRHVCKSFYHGMPSCLVKTLGVYRIGTKNLTTGRWKIDWVIIYENIGFNLPPDVMSYDLKGTRNSRRYVKAGQSRTRMDLNFCEDMQGLPICLSIEDKRYLDASIWNDSLFLYKQNVIDYSLLVIIDVQSKTLSAAVIDYNEEYTFEKAIERRYKQVVTSGTPTIIGPFMYKNRFRSVLLRQFLVSVV